MNECIVCKSKMIELFDIIEDKNEFNKLLKKQC